MKKILAKLQHRLPSVFKNEEGATMIEYAIMVALIAVVSIAIITSLGRTVSGTFSIVNSSMSTANTNAG